MTDAPVSFAKAIQSTLVASKAIPFFGFPPPFPWEALSQQLGSSLQLGDIAISPRKVQFLPASELTAGLGIGFFTIALEMTPLSGQAFWLMPRDDAAKLAALTLLSNNGSKGFSSPKFLEGFYYFISTQALQALDALHPFKNLFPKIGKLTTIPLEDALCIDVEIQHAKQTLWGRVVCPSTFLNAFKTHFSTEPPPPLTSAPKGLELSLRTELGHTSLSLAEWKKIRVGDCILLDRCTFDPKTQKGSVTLCLEETPLLRGRIKDTSIKIVDYAFYQEEQSPMTPETPDSSEHDEQEIEEESHLWSSQSGESAAVEKIIAAKEIPLTLTVEVARLKISLDKLLQLAPGNILELPVKPEQGVDVTIGGKKVAKAELVKLQDMIGIKILRLGE